jgi:hypothetical protein
MDVTGSDTDGTSHIYKDRAGAETIKTKKTDQTFSDGERERTVKEVKDPESEKAKQVKTQPTCSLPNPAQKSVNSGEKFSAAAAVVFEIPAEKKRGFYDALRQYAANTGVSRPSAYAKVTMSNLEQTGMCSLWDDFEAGLELGTSDRPSHEWLDPESGKPYPFLVRAVEEIAKAKSNDPVAAATEAAKIINNPKLCQPIWASVKRDLLHHHKEAQRMQRLGVQHTYLPPRYSDKPLEPALDEVKEAIALHQPPTQVEAISSGQETPNQPEKSTEESPAVKPQGFTLLADTLASIRKKSTPSTDRPCSVSTSDPWEEQRQPVDHKTFEERDRESQERINRAKNKAPRQIQEQQALQEIKGKLSSNPQERQSQLQIWMNGKHPYPAIAKRLIETNYQWGLYLDGTRVLEEEF